MTFVHQSQVFLLSTLRWMMQICYFILQWFR